MNKRLIFTASAIVLAAGFAFFVPRAAPNARPQTSLSALAGAPLETYGARAARPAAQTALRSLRSAMVVYVAGEVTRAGVYRLPASARVGDALRSAGGATAAADLVAVNLAAPLADGEEVVVPARGASNDVAPAAGPPSFASTARGQSTRGPRRAHRKRRKHAHRSSSAMVPNASISDLASTPAVDVNLADAAALEDLPGIGQSLAERIVAYRSINGPFSTIDDLLDVNGITDSRLQEIAPYIVVAK